MNPFELSIVILTLYATLITMAFIYKGNLAAYYKRERDYLTLQLNDFLNEKYGDKAKVSLADSINRPKFETLYEQQLKNAKERILKRLNDDQSTSYMQGEFKPQHDLALVEAHKAMNNEKSN